MNEEIKYTNLLPSTVIQMNNILDILANDSELIAKIDNLEIGLCKNEKGHQTFFISRDIK